MIWAATATTAHAADCNTNGTQDSNESAYHDCNANAILDACETAGTVLLAFDQGIGSPTGYTFYSDLRQGQVLTDDFNLLTSQAITGVELMGVFAPPGPGPTSADSFIIRFWTGASAPVTQISSQYVPAAAISRSGNVTFRLRLPTPVLLGPGKHWLEAIYSGTAPGFWKWNSRGPRSGAFSRWSFAKFPEFWNNTYLDSHWDFRIFSGAADADSNGIPDSCFANPCLACAGDLNGDDRSDGQDINAFVTTLLGGQSAGGMANCADIDTDGDVDQADLALFSAKLMSPSNACPLPPPPDLPVARRLFIRYLADGAYKLSDGIPEPLTQRPLIIAGIANVGAAGFGRFATVCGIGMARADAEAEAYFAPIVAAAQSANVKFIPGFWLLNVIDAIYGVPFEPPWNLPNDPLLKPYHPMNPAALATPAFWTTFVNVTRTLARAAHTDSVYVDAEQVFWLHQANPFWTDANLSAVRVLLRNAVAQLRQEGIFILVHHPRPQPTPVEIFRIATSLFAPDGPDDPLAHVEHTALLPGQRVTPGPLITTAQVEAMYTSTGFRAEQVRFGFTEYNNIAGGVLGWDAIQFNAMLVQNPAIAERTWFFAGDHRSIDHAAAFALLGPPPIP